MPRGITGPWYVIVIADADDVVFEGDKQNNNGGATTVPLIIDTPPPADLEVGTITIPASAQTGRADPGPVDGQQRRRIRRQRFVDRRCVSVADAVWNISDASSATSSSSSGTVQPGGSYTSTLNADLPSAIPGQYRIIVRCNIFDESAREQL